MPFKIYTACLLALSLITFIVYVIDKNKAENGDWRIPEWTLLLLSVCGGAIGGYTAMFLVKHKTRKWYFHAAHMFGLLWQVFLFGYLLCLLVVGG